MLFSAILCLLITVRGSMNEDVMRKGKVGVGIRLIWIIPDQFACDHI